jgi:hypothetical protein
MSEPWAQRPHRPPPELAGDPIYVPEPYPQPGSWAAPGAPPADPAARQRERVSEPVVGWLVAVVGLVIVVAALLPWASALGFTIDGTAGDGKITIACGVVVSIVGVLIGTGQGHLWTSITALVTTMIVGLVGLVDVVGGVTVVSYYNGLVAIESGLWLTLVAGLLGVGLSVVALVRRDLAAAG